MVQIHPASMAVAVVYGRMPRSAWSGCGTRSATARLLGSTSWKETNFSSRVWLMSSPRKPVQSMNRSPASAPFCLVITSVSQPRSSVRTSTTSSTTWRTPRSAPYLARNRASRPASKWYAYGNCARCSSRVERPSDSSRPWANSEPSSMRGERCASHSAGVTKQAWSKRRLRSPSWSHQSASVNPSDIRRRSKGW